MKRIWKIFVSFVIILLIIYLYCTLDLKKLNPSFFDKNIDKYNQFVEYVIEKDYCSSYKTNIDGCEYKEASKDVFVKKTMKDLKISWFIYVRNTVEVFVDYYYLERSKKGKLPEFLFYCIGDKCSGYGGEIAENWYIEYIEDYEGKCWLLKMIWYLIFGV